MGFFLGTYSYCENLECNIVGSRCGPPNSPNSANNVSTDVKMPYY